MKQLRIISIMLAALVLGACQVQQEVVRENVEAVENGETAFTLPEDSVPEIEIVGGVGDIRIKAADLGDEVIIDYTKHAFASSEDDAEAELFNVRMDIFREENRIRINTQQPGSDERTNTVDLTLRVPYTTIRLRVENSVGDISVQNVRISGVLTIENGVGAIEVDAMTIPAGVNLSTNVGDIKLVGTLGAEGDYAISAGVGTITLRLPADTNAQLDASVGVGRLDVRDFELSDTESDERPTGGTLTGSLGSGGPTLSVTVETGDLIVRQQ